MSTITHTAAIVAAATAAALVTALAPSIGSTPAFAQDEGAPCSWGSDNVCALVTTCVAKISVRIPYINIPVSRCIEWEEEVSYWKNVPYPPETSTPGTSPPDAEDPPIGEPA